LLMGKSCGRIAKRKVTRSQKETVGDHQPDLTSKLGYYEDEIDLFELLMVLWRNRLIVCIVFLLSLAAAVIYSFSATPLYKISAQVQSGITDFRAPERSEESTFASEPVRGVDAQVLKSYFTQSPTWHETEPNVARMPGPNIQVKIPRKSSVAEIYFYWPDPKKGTSLLNDMIAKLKDADEEKPLNSNLDFSRKRIKTAIMEERAKEKSLKLEQKKLTRAIELKKKRVQELEKEAELIRKNILKVKNTRNELAKQIEGIKEDLGYYSKFATDGNPRRKKKTSRTTTAIPIQQYPLILVNIQSRLMDLEGKLNDYRLRTLDSRRMEIDRLRGEIQDMESYRDGGLQRELLSAEKEIDLLKSQLSMLSLIDVVVPPHASPSPVKPRKKLLWALGGVLGLFLGVFAAFMREFWVRNREKFYANNTAE